MFVGETNFGGGRKGDGAGRGSDGEEVGQHSACRGMCGEAG